MSSSARGGQRPGLDQRCLPGVQGCSNGLELHFPAPAGLPEPRVQQRRIRSAPRLSLRGRLDPRAPLALPRRKLPAGPPASLVLSTSSSPQLASCLLSVPPFPHPSSLSLPLSVPLNFRFPPSFPLPLSEGREKLGVSLGGLKLGTGFLLRCGFPKGPSPHATLGAAPSERHHALSEEGGTKLCLSSLQPHV